MTGRRRGRGEGTISKRRDGRWMGRVDLGWQAGKRVRKTVYGKTRLEVANKLHTVHASVLKGLPLVGEKQTVGQFLTDWLAHSVRPSVRPRTFSDYEQKVRLHIIPYLGRVRLSKLTPQHVLLG